MKKTFFALLCALALVCASSAPCLAQMEIPATGSTNWNVPLDFDLNELNAILGGTTQAPAGFWNAAPLAAKPAAAVAATANLTLSSLQTVDGHTGVANDIVLVTAQTNAAQNGPWLMQTGAWTRPAWYPTGGTTQAFQFITELIRLGTTYQGTTWRMTTAGAITIDTTPTTWAVTPLALNSHTVTGSLPGLVSEQAFTGSTLAARVLAACNSFGGANGKVQIPSTETSTDTGFGVMPDGCTVDDMRGIVFVNSGLGYQVTSGASQVRSELSWQQRNTATTTCCTDPEMQHLNYEPNGGGYQTYGPASITSVSVDSSNNATIGVAVVPQNWMPGTPTLTFSGVGTATWLDTQTLVVSSIDIAANTVTGTLTPGHAAYSTTADTGTITGGTKTNYTTQALGLLARTSGQTNGQQIIMTHNSAGDTIGQDVVLHCNGPMNSQGDEACKAHDVALFAGTAAMTATISTLSGSTLTMSCTNGLCNNLGEGQPLLNTSRGEYTAGTVTITSAGGTPPLVTGVGTSWASLCPGGTAPCNPVNLYFEMNAETVGGVHVTIPILTVTDNTHLTLNNVNAGVYQQTYGGYVTSGAYTIYQGSTITQVPRCWTVAGVQSCDASESTPYSTVQAVVSDPTQFQAGDNILGVSANKEPTVGYSLHMYQNVPYPGNASGAGVAVSNSGNFPVYEAYSAVGLFNEDIFRAFWGNSTHEIAPNWVFRLQGPTPANGVLYFDDDVTISSNVSVTNVAVVGGALSLVTASNAWATGNQAKITGCTAATWLNNLTVTVASSPAPTTTGFTATGTYTNYTAASDTCSAGLLHNNSEIFMQAVNSLGAADNFTYNRTGGLNRWQLNNLYASGTINAANLQQNGLGVLTQNNGNVVVSGNLAGGYGGIGIYQNLLTHSQFDVGSSEWIAQYGTLPTLTANTTDVLDPWGGNTAQKAVMSGTTAQGQGQAPSPAMTAGNTYDFSLWARGAVGGEWFRMVVGSGGAPCVPPTVYYLTTTWTQYQVVCPFTTGMTNIVYWDDNSGAGDTVYVAGAQLSAFPSGYIHTTSSPINFTGVVANGTPVTTGPPAFSAVTPGTNVTALVIGSGGSLGTYGTGTIAATTAANLSGTPALPNGTTATTQAANDNSSKLATTQYVNSAVGASGAGVSSLTASGPLAASGSTGAVTVSCPGCAVQLGSLNAATTFTGATGWNRLADVTVPAGSMGSNGTLEICWYGKPTIASGTFYYGVYFGGAWASTTNTAGSTQMVSVGTTSSGGNYHVCLRISNRGATNSQVSDILGVLGSAVINDAEPTATSAYDTTQAQHITLAVNLPNATDSVSNSSMQVHLWPQLP